MLNAFLLENHAFSEAVWKIGVDTDRQTDQISRTP